MSPASLSRPLNVVPHPSATFPTSPARTYFMPPKVWMAHLDALAIAAALTITALAVEEDAVSPYLVVGFAVVGVLWLAGLYLLGAYDDARVLQPGRAILRVLLLAGIAGVTLPMLSATLVTPSFELAMVGTVAWMLAARFLAGLLICRGAVGTRFAVVGRREDLDEAVSLIERSPHAGGAVALEIELGGSLDALGRASEPGSLEERVTSNRIDCIVLVGAEARRPELLGRVRKLCYEGIAVLDRVALEERVVRRVRPEWVDDRWLLAAATSGSAWHLRWAKRAVDLAGALGILFLAWPVLAAAAALVRLTSPGPALYRQERVGRHGRTFPILKLRTMYQDAEKRSGPVWSTDADPRITPVGRYLRKFRVDELPQLWNVLRGEMSLIGPRPERPVFVEQLAQSIPHYKDRHLVKPGITGWAQVMAPYAASVEDAWHKHTYDLFYVKHVSLVLDLLILMKTVRTVVFGREREQGGVVTTAVGAPATAVATSERNEASRSVA
jgi:exopolysaccharide biosynthesis polyprenyl glycosylphosphotransferase